MMVTITLIKCRLKVKNWWGRLKSISKASHHVRALVNCVKNLHKKILIWIISGLWHLMIQIYNISHRLRLPKRYVNLRRKLNLRGLHNHWIHCLILVRLVYMLPWIIQIRLLMHVHSCRTFIVVLIVRVCLVIDSILQRQGHLWLVLARSAWLPIMILMLLICPIISSQIMILVLTYRHILLSFLVGNRTLTLDWSGTLFFW